MAPTSGIRPDKEPEPEWLVRDLIASMFDFKFEPKRPTRTVYARVWKYKNINDRFKKVSEEPAGIITHKHPIGKSKWTRDDLYWIKIDSEWISSNVDDPVFARGDQITEAEFGTDIAFGLFKPLKVTRRPLRTWYKRNRPLILKWNIFGAALSVIMLSYSTGKVTRDEFDIWAIVGIFFAVWSISSIIWMCKSITYTK